MANRVQQIAGGQPQGGELSPFQGIPEVMPGQVQGADIQKIVNVLEQIIPQATDQNGYLDITKLASMWPQAAVQAGLNLPFQTLLEILKQQPELIQDLIIKLGLAGIILEGKVISGEQLAGAGTGGGAPTQSQPAPQGVPQGAGRVA